MLALASGEVAGQSRTVSPERLLVTVLRNVRPAPALAELIDGVCAPQDCHPPGTTDADQLIIAIVRAADAQLHPLFELIRSHGQREQLRCRALATGIAARWILADRGENQLAAAGFACGYLLRIGQIALCALFPKAYNRLLGQAAAAPGGVVAAERRVLGLDHTILGNHIAAAWGLSPRFRNILWRAHDASQAPDGPDAPTLSSALTLADEFTRRAGIGLPDFTGLASLSPDEVTCSDHLGARLDNDVLVLAQRIQKESPTVDTVARREHPRDAASVPSSNDLRLLAAHFLDRSNTGDLYATCEAVARSAQRACHARVAVAFAAVEANQDWPAFVLGNDERRAVLPLNDGLHDFMSECTGGSAIGVRSLHQVPAAVLSANTDIAEALGPDADSCHLLPLIHAGQAVGGVLLAGDRLRDELPWTHADLQLLAAAYGAALTAALRTHEQQRIVESLAATSQPRDRDATDRTSRLQLLASMAAGAAHELNNPLAVITGRAQMLQRESTDPAMQEELSVINEHAHRASEIVSELLAYAKPPAPQPESVVLTRQLDRLHQRWQRDTARGATQIEVQISDHALAAFVDPEQLDVVLDAIMANALTACGATGARVIINSSSQPSDDTIVVSIGDDGCGMSPDVLAHAFDPFFSHRPAGRGRGLGLSRAARLIEINGGRVWIDSTVGSGTTVHLALPARAPEHVGH